MEPEMREKRGKNRQESTARHGVRGVLLLYGKKKR
jgi:hypothetical protein